MTNRIKELREELRMSQVRLGVELGTTQETISSYEVGRHFPSVAMLLKMSKLFNASIDYILGLSNVRAHVSIDGLSERERKALSLLGRLTSAQQDRAIAYMQGLLE